MFYNICSSAHADFKNSEKMNFHFETLPALISLKMCKEDIQEVLIIPAFFEEIHRAIFENHQSWLNSLNFERFTKFLLKFSEDDRYSNKYCQKSHSFLIYMPIDDNNPFYLKKTTEKWEGKADPPPENSDYEKFENLKMGIRAGIVNIRTSITIHGRNTLEKIIMEQYPNKHKLCIDIDGEEVDFITFVERDSGIPKDDELEFEDKEKIVKLASSMIKFLNPDINFQKDLLQTVNDAYDMAFEYHQK